MRIIKAKNYEEMSFYASRIISSLIIKKPSAVLGLATGSTPIDIYKNIVKEYKMGILDFKDIKTVNLDEYCGLSASHEQSYRYYMEFHLFRHVNISKENIYIPEGISSEYSLECQSYDEKLERLGNIDLQLLGLGHNGHIGFNEPGDEFVMNTHRVKLHPTTVEANSRFFSKDQKVPDSAITLGIKAIMNSKTIVLATGSKDKEEILKKALFGPVTPKVPASILQLHKNLIVITQ